MSSALRIGWSKYWSSSFSNSPSNKYSGLISFRTDWFDLLGVLGILKRLLQHRIVKVSVLVFESRSNDFYNLLHQQMMSSDDETEGMIALVCKDKKAQGIELFR